MTNQTKWGKRELRFLTPERLGQIFYQQMYLSQTKKRRETMLYIVDLVTYKAIEQQSRADSLQGILLKEKKPSTAQDQLNKTDELLIQAVVLLRVTNHLNYQAGGKQTFHEIKINAENVKDFLAKFDNGAGGQQ